MKSEIAPRYATITKIDYDIEMKYTTTYPTAWTTSGYTRNSVWSTAPQPTRSYYTILYECFNTNNYYSTNMTHKFNTWYKVSNDPTPFLGLVHEFELEWTAASIVFTISRITINYKAYFELEGETFTVEDSSDYVVDNNNRYAVMTIYSTDADKQDVQYLYPSDLQCNLTRITLWKTTQDMVYNDTTVQWNNHLNLWIPPN